MFDDRKLLTRYWINVDDLMGIGVTAYSIEDALSILANEGIEYDRIKGIVENIDVRELDQGHVMPNMGPPSFRGVWYPCLNIGWRYPRRDIDAIWSEERKPERYIICQIRVRGNEKE
jgi:hypothetical protein